MHTYLRSADVMPLLVEACPSFRARWEERKAWSGDESFLHGDIAEFADHLADLARRGELAELPPSFAAIERLLAEGDDDVENAVCVSFLEDLAFGNHFGSLRAAERALGPYFGARTLADWRDITAPQGIWDRLRRWWLERSVRVSQN
jgi:hypothetical protein